LKTLYISDLDGTLLRNNETLSKYTCDTINRLVNNGLQFSFATARSRVTAEKATKDLDCKIPMIVYNGTMIVDSISKEVLISNFFEYNEIAYIKDVLKTFDITPIVYSFQNGSEKFSYVPKLVNEHMRLFLDTRKGDIRENPVKDIQQLFNGEVFYFTCIDIKQKLKSAYEVLKQDYNCIYQKDYYSNRQWLEIVPKGANKSNAVLQLKKFLNCDRIVSFGDGINDISMFKISDECYAVQNAVDEIKFLATEIIESNQNDGVAKWLEFNAQYGGDT